MRGESVVGEITKTHHVERFQGEYFCRVRVGRDRKKGYRNVEQVGLRRRGVDVDV